MSHFDIIVVGAGHNGLVAATLLARKGLKVAVFEQAPVLGGATRTEKPFEASPNLGQSTGAYLLGLMPPEVISAMGVEIPTVRRDPHYFLPTTDDRYLLFGSDQAEMKRQFLEFFSQADWDANQRLQAEVSQLREDIGPTWLQSPLSIEDTAERFVRPALRQVFVDLCRGSVGDYLERFGFQSDLIKAMYAVTDGFSGSNSTWDTPGSGHNFLVHNMCRLPAADGTWMVVEGGMGTVSGRFAGAARAAGVEFHTDAGVQRIEAGTPARVHLKDGREFTANAVVTNADPFTTRNLVGRTNYPESLNSALDGQLRDGTTMKVNMALSELPTFTCLPEDRGQHQATIHILPDESEVLGSLKTSYDAVQNGKLPEFPTIEWYIHTTIDPSLQDEKGRHSSALFVQWVPYELDGTTWEAEADRYAEHLIGLCERFAPGIGDLVDDTFILTPQSVESYFGIHRGHIHHIDNIFGFADRHPHRSPLEGLYSCSAGTHPAGSVIGAAGYNAAQAVLEDMELS